MSYECGECEMDLRSGHAPGCSRYRPEKAVSGHLLVNDIIHESDTEEVEQMVLHVLSGERARLRERVEQKRGAEAVGGELWSPKFTAGYWVGWNRAFEHVLAFLVEPEPTKGTPQCESEQ